MKRLLILTFIISMLGGAIVGSQSSIVPGSNRNTPPQILPAGIPQAGQSGFIPGNKTVYALDADNSVWKLGPNQRQFRKEIQFSGLGGGNLIGIDFRPSDGQLYGMTDTGNLYVLDVFPPRVGRAALVSTLASGFAGGFQSLLDFNPVLNAIRLIGSNDQNYALVSNQGDLNQVLMQTSISYAQGDVAAGVDPSIVGGAYTNNIAGAMTTIFYGLDFDRDSLVTFPIGANGSSATGAGQLQTIGRLVDQSGTPVNISPTADIDIYTINEQNFLLGLSGRTLFSIDLAQIPAGLPLGQTIKVVAVGRALNDGGFIDIAVGF